MGIDIYAKWRHQTEKEKQAQFTGFDTTKGNVGYLREAYHGGPYVTRFLVEESFNEGSGEVKISAKTLRERLPRALELCDERIKNVYPKSTPEDIEAYKKSFVDFVELCEQKEKETGEPCEIIASY